MKRTTQKLDTAVSTRDGHVRPGYCVVSKYGSNASRFARPTSLICDPVPPDAAIHGV